MKTSFQIRLALLFLFLSILSVPAVARDVGPIARPAPLTLEQIEIYRVFLESYMKDNNAVIVNLANETTPFSAWPSYANETNSVVIWSTERTPEYLKGIEFEDLEKAQSTIRFIDFRSLFPGRIVL